MEANPIRQVNKQPKMIVPLGKKRFDIALAPSVALMVQDMGDFLVKTAQILGKKQQDHGVAETGGRPVALLLWALRITEEYFV